MSVADTKIATASVVNIVKLPNFSSGHCKTVSRHPKNAIILVVDAINCHSIIEFELTTKVYKETLPIKKILS